MSTFQTPLDAELTITVTGGRKFVGDVIASGPNGCTLLTSEGEIMIAQSIMTRVVDNDVLNARSIQRIKFDKNIEQQHSIAQLVETTLFFAGGDINLALKNVEGSISNNIYKGGVIDCLEQMVAGTTSTFNEELAIKHSIAIVTNEELDDDGITVFLHHGKGSEPRSTEEVESKQVDAPTSQYRRQDGYGSNISTDTMVLWRGRWRRVYANCWSNCATHYINSVDGKITVLLLLKG